VSYCSACEEEEVCDPFKYLVKKETVLLTVPQVRPVGHIVHSLQWAAVEPEAPLGSPGEEVQVPAYHHYSLQPAFYRLLFPHGGGGRPCPGRADGGVPVLEVESGCGRRLVSAEHMTEAFWLHTTSHTPGCAQCVQACI
jgi:hypothetical protein